MRLPLEAVACALLAAACSTNKPPETASTTVTTGDTAVTTAGSESSDVTRTPSDDTALAHTSTTDTDEASARHQAAAHPAPATSGTADTEATRSSAQKTESNATPPSTPPDNTKVNERDTRNAAMTPVDQGENATDLKLTQQIRKAVMGDKSLSFTAKNVKIITLNKKVTLRGPVKTAAERSSIEAAARKVAGAGMVDNQIEVTQ
jgi:hyperosmotically inducible protein